MTPAAWPPVFGFVGPHNAGKTTLLERLLRVWGAGGLRVGVAKHTHHPLRAGDPHADSERLKAAGGAAVIATTPELPWSAAVEQLLRHDPALDLIVLEGYHAAPVAQVIVLSDTATLAEERERARGWVVGIAAPEAPPDASVPWWPRDQVEGLAAFIAGHTRPVPGTGTRVAAAVLAGGASRRMGADKAALVWQGRTWLEHVRSAAGEATGGVAMVVGGGGAEPWRVPDLTPGAGPLAGLATAWNHTRAPWLLLCACDMPQLDGAALAPLVERIDPDHAAIVPVIGGRRQYLCAAYSRHAGPSAWAALAAGVRGLHAWLKDLPVLDLDEAEWRRRGIDPTQALADFDDPTSLPPAPPPSTR